jgi:N4-gp56 family major capsid protein
MANVSTLNYNDATQLTYWIPTLWSLKVYEEAKAKMFWNRFAGPEGSGMPVIIKSELLREAGDTINISQLANLSGTGVSGESTLRGNEEKLTIRQVTTSPEWYRHAVADTRKARKQINQNFRMKAQGALSYWMAKLMDSSMWTAARVVTAAGFESTIADVIYANNATSVDTIDTADTFGVEEIRKCSAVLAGKNIDKISTPGMPAGEGYYIMFIHPFQAYSLKSDSEWISNHQNASIRGAGNPLFTGALGEIDGVIVHATTQCSVVANAASPSVDTARAVMVGQEALCRGVNEDIIWSEQYDDYDFVQGIGVSAAFEDKILSVNALVHCVSACVDPSA